MSGLRVAVITGSRAEYGLLYWVIRALSADPHFDVRVIATGSHLAPEFGMTVHDIERDGVRVDERVEMLVASDTPGGVARSMALGLIGLSDALARQAPDLVLLLGDRFETLAAAQACLLARIPVAHLAGGDVTEGALDDAMRHAITKLSHLHLVSNEESARRVVQMGELPQRVHVVGNPGLDAFREQPLMARPAVQEALGRPLAERNVLVVFHPETLPAGSDTRPLADSAAAATGALIGALEGLSQGAAFWVVMPNADEGGRAIKDRWRQWAAGRTDVCLIESVPRAVFLGLMAQCELMVGNSSSALGEAPSLKVPAVDIGRRQASRLAAANVLRCEATCAAIAAAMAQALALDCSGVVNPYGDGMTGPRVAALLKAVERPRELLAKPFHWVAGPPPQEASC